MAVRSYTEQIDTLYTTTWQARSAEVANNVFNITPAWAAIQKFDGFKKQVGGRYIEVNLEYQKNDTITWLSKGGTVPIQDTEKLTTAMYSWKYVAASIVRFWTDEQKNAGSSKLIDKVATDLNNAENALVDEWENVLFTTTTDAITPIPTFIPTSANSVGGIDGSTYSWWDCQRADMTGKSAADYLVQYMRTMYNDCTKGKQTGRPNLIITTQTIYEWYEDNLLDYFRFMGKQAPDFGFEHLMFKGTPIVWALSCTANSMFFINTRYLKLYYDPTYWFKMTEWKPIPDQPNDRVAQIVCTAQLTCSRRQSQGVIYNIDTA